MIKAYYNEFDPNAAAWLRNLIRRGLISPGDVDERSIEDVRPDDLRGYERVHFFAGIGVWDYALTRAGWRGPVWTGSCPCQPFSAAGAGDGFADERHLWPAFFHLIRECQPRIVFGEQVEAAIRHSWLDLVQTDLEGIGYSFGPTGLPACGFGAPHIRQRIFFVAKKLADADLKRLSETTGTRLCAERSGEQERPESTGELQGRPEGLGGPCCRNVGDAECTGLEGHSRANDCVCESRREQADATGSVAAPSCTNGFWSDADWLPFRDSKIRPIESGVKQMADGSSSSLGRLCSEEIKKIEGEINEWALRYKTDAGKALFDLWQEISTQALRFRSTGGLCGVHAPQILLAFLRQLTEQGWAFSESLSCTSAEKSKVRVRMLWHDEDTSCPPRERGLDRQCCGESSDAMRILSSILARYAQENWGEAYAKNARNVYPLVDGEPSIAGKLKAYGNAIVAPVAEEFIRAFMSCDHDTP